MSCENRAECEGIDTDNIRMLWLSHNTDILTKNRTQNATLSTLLKQDCMIASAKATTCFVACCVGCQSIITKNHSQQHEQRNSKTTFDLQRICFECWVQIKRQPIRVELKVGFALRGGWGERHKEPICDKRSTNERARALPCTSSSPHPLQPAEDTQCPPR
jgi:hypothetical protein